MKKIILLLIISLSFTVYAGGVISIKGDLLQKCSDKNCQVKMGPQLYILDLKRLSSSQIKLFKSKKPGDNVSENIPMAAVLDVKDIK